MMYVKKYPLRGIFARKYAKKIPPMGYFLRKKYPLLGYFSGFFRRKNTPYAADFFIKFRANFARNLELNFFLKIHFYIGILKDSYIKFIFHLKIELQNEVKNRRFFTSKSTSKRCFFTTFRWCFHTTNRW